MLTGGARVAGVIGWPVGHSRSPVLHNTWLARHRIDGAYVPLPVAPTALAAAVAGLAAAGFAGANVTVPHKQAVLALCDRLTPAAARIGAVNTLVFRDDGIEGDSTDGWGFMASLAEAKVAPRAALVLGAGGAARAIVAALIDAGAGVTVANRTDETARSLSAEFGATAVPWTDRARALAAHDLLVNATSAGLRGETGAPIDLDGAPPTMAVSDIVYAPLETALLAAARARGLRAIDGLGMLLHQARPGFAAWFGVMPDVDPSLRAAVLATS